MKYNIETRNKIINILKTKKEEDKKMEIFHNEVLQQKMKYEKMQIHNLECIHDSVLPHIERYNKTTDKKIQKYKEYLKLLGQGYVKSAETIKVKKEAIKIIKEIVNTIKILKNKEKENG